MRNYCGGYYAVPQSFASLIQSRCRFVENKDSWICQEDTRKFALAAAHRLKDQRRPKYRRLNLCEAKEASIITVLFDLLIVP